jgi:hypothetical protein
MKRRELLVRTRRGSASPEGNLQRAKTLPHLDLNQDLPVNSRLLCRLSYEGLRDVPRATVRRYPPGPKDGVVAGVGFEPTTFGL